MHNHVSRGQTPQKIISPPPLNAEKVRKWVFGPIRMKGKRNLKGKSMPLYPPFPVSTPPSPQPFWPSHEREMSLHLALATV